MKKGKTNECDGRNFELWFRWGNGVRFLQSIELMLLLECLYRTTTAGRLIVDPSKNPSHNSKLQQATVFSKTSCFLPFLRDLRSILTLKLGSTEEVHIRLKWYAFQTDLFLIQIIWAGQLLPHITITHHHRWSSSTHNNNHSWWAMLFHWYETYIATK